MNKTITIKPLTKTKFNEAVEVVYKSGLDTRAEIEDHLKHIKAHYVAVMKDKIIGVIGWYRDNVNYATEAMGDKFPGEDAYWVGFFVVDEQYRKQGVGFDLLQKLESVLSRKNVTNLWVASVPETRNYYQRQGFKLVMTGKIRGNDRYFLVKNLKY